MSVFTLLLLLVAGLLVASWFLVPRPWAWALLGLWRRMSHLASHTIEVQGVRWHYLRGGKGSTLLLLHGFGADANCWLWLAPHLGPRFSLLIPDLPGFGESEPPEKLNFAIETQAHRLTQFLDALGIEQCIVAGNSMGGYLATALGARDPDRVRGLWLLAPLGVRSAGEGEILDAIDAGEPEYFQITTVRQFRERVLSTMFSEKRWIPAPLVKSLARHAISIRDSVPRMLQEARFESKPLESIANRVVQPTLVQWGEDDRVLNPAGLSVLEQAFPNASCTMTKHCGHLPMLERPRESARVFLGFLDDKGLV